MIGNRRKKITSIKALAVLQDHGIASLPILPPTAIMFKWRFFIVCCNIGSSWAVSKSLHLKYLFLLTVCRFLEIVRTFHTVYYSERNLHFISIHSCLACSVKGMTFSPCCPPVVPGARLKDSPVKPNRVIRDSLEGS